MTGLWDIGRDRSVAIGRDRSMDIGRDKTKKSTQEWVF